VKAIGFFYSWSGRRELDSYFDQVASAFGALGIELHVVLANELLHPNGSLHGLNPFVSEKKLLRFVARERPDFLFSVNNAGMTAALERSFPIPIVKWLVDDLPHLFFHDGVAAAERLFDGPAQVICYSTTLAGQVAAAAATGEGRISWVAHGTNLAGAEFGPGEPTIPISFIGTCLDHRPFLAVLKAAAPRGAAAEVLRALAMMKQDYIAAAAAPLDSEVLAEAIREAGFDAEHFKRILTDLATTQNRIQGLLQIEDLGLHLFGNDLWLNSLAVTPRLADRFEFVERVNSYQRLLSTYARSRISVNIPNVQNCAGLAVRVFDVMASPSLLITEYHPDSDLIRLFGADCPVPMYKDFGHLRELCRHYLDHEEERLALVAKCNALVGSAFLLPNRLGEMLAAGGVEVPRGRATAKLYEIIDTRRFYGFPRTVDRVEPWVRLAGKRLLKQLAGPILTLRPSD
jgi:hypothetical protein